MSAGWQVVWFGPKEKAQDMESFCSVTLGNGCDINPERDGEIERGEDTSILSQKACQFYSYVSSAGFCNLKTP